MAAPQARSSRRARRIRENLRAQQRPCCICGNPIDYTLEYPHPKSFSEQHIKPWSTHPHLREDPDNIDAAHLDCNRGNPTTTPPLDPKPLGQTSRNW